MKEEWREEESHTLSNYVRVKSTSKSQKNTDFAFDVNPVAFLPHGGLERLTGQHRLHKADLGGGVVSKINSV